MSSKLVGETWGVGGGQSLADCEIEAAEQEIREKCRNQKIWVCGLRPF